MARWQEIADGVPEFATAVHGAFDAHLHKTIATLRRDGAPRISAIEVTFLRGDVWLGMMPGSLKALDLRRDPRVAVHSATVETDLVRGDAKIAGRAFEVDDPATMLELAHGNEEIATGAHLLRVDASEVVLTRVSGTLLVIDSWHEGRGLEHRERT